GMSHPNIVAVHDLGDRDGLLYYVRDFPAGEPLSDRLAYGVLSPSEAIRLGLDLLGAIGAAHRRGVIHLDIRPENIVVSADGFVLTGFGLASTSEAGDDLYCTGLLLYQALTNRLWPEAKSSRLTRWSAVPRRLRSPWWFQPGGQPERRELRRRSRESWPLSPSNRPTAEMTAETWPTWYSST